MSPAPGRASGRWWQLDTSPRRHRGREARIIENAHYVLMDELTGAALPSQNSALMPPGFASASRSRSTSASAYPWNCTSPDPNGCAFSCSTPSARSSDTPARLSCAAPKEIARVLAGALRTLFSLAVRVESPSHSVGLNVAAPVPDLRVTAICQLDLGASRAAW
jgi:hypothetical protein